MDKKYLEDRLRELGIYSDYYHRMELKPLAALLSYDEKVNCILTGYFEGNRRMIAVTDSRIVVVSQLCLAECPVRCQSQEFDDYRILDE